LAIIADGEQAIVVIYREGVEINKFLVLLYNFILNPATTASSNPFRVGSRGWGTLIHQNHADGEKNGSIMVGMFVYLCLASKKSSEREFLFMHPNWDSSARNSVPSNPTSTIAEEN
jgi:hypothetical protein